MATAICRKSDGVLVRGAQWDAVSFDGATEVAITVDAVPFDPAVVRWDGGTGLRAETTNEFNARLTAKKNAEAVTKTTTDKANAVLLELVRVHLNEVRAAVIPPLPDLKLADLQAELQTLYKALP